MRSTTAGQSVKPVLSDEISVNKGPPQGCILSLSYSVHMVSHGTNWVRVEYNVERQFS